MLLCIKHEVEMRFPVLISAFCAVSFSAVAQTPDASPSTPVETVTLEAFEPSREDAVLEAYVDGLVEAHRREHDTPGVTVSVVIDGRLVFAKGYGYADAENGRRVSGHETLFRIGSVSKTFVWTAVMMLAERGAINLDADINLYLKDMSIPEAYGAPITMNDLMAHRAGFEDTFSVFTVRDDAELTLTDALKAHMPKRVFAPGARTSYSNWGTALAAKIVEDVSGVSFNAFMQTEMLTPLAMTKTDINGPSVMSADMRDRLSAGHEVKNGAAEATDYMEIGPYAPVGGIAASASDLAVWMLVHLGQGEHDGVQLMSPQTHQRMWDRAFKDRLDGADLAHGFFSKNYRGYEVYGHGGATSAFYTYMTLVPELDLGVFVSQNATNDRTLVSDLPDLIIDRVGGRRSGGATHTSEAMATTAKDYEGVYLINRRSFSRFEKLFAANGVTAIAAMPDGAIVATTDGKSVRLEPLAGAADIYQDPYGGRISFGRNEKGAVTHLTGSMGVHSFEKIGPINNPATLNLALGAAVFFSATMFLGAWRRFGRGDATPSTIGAALSIFGLAASALVFAFVAALVLVINMLSTASASDLLDYPPAIVVWLRLISYGVFAMAALAVFSLAPAWTSSGWSLWRKTHHTLFALAMAGLGVMLVIWNFIFAATA